MKNKIERTPYRECKEILYDTAWFFGATASDGFVNGVKQDGKYTQQTGYQCLVKFAQRDAEFLGRINETGRRIFGIRPVEHAIVRDTKIGPKEYLAVDFNSKGMAMYMGDLRGGCWHKTIKSKHPWVMRKPFVYAFLSGFFDGDGSVSDPIKNKKMTRLRITIGYTEPALFLLDIFRSIGFSVTYPSIEELHSAGIYNYDEIVQKYSARGAVGSFKIYRRRDRVSKHNPLGIKDVGVYHAATVQKLAGVLDSSVHEKERRLELFRGATIIDETPRAIIEAYHSAMALRRQSVKQGEPLGARRILKHKEFSQHAHQILPYTKNPVALIRNWIHSQNNPVRDKGHFYSRIEFAT